MRSKETETSPVRVLFLGSRMYRNPLTPTDAKKFRELSRIARVWVVAFSPSWRPRRLVQDATFLLLPRPPCSLGRYGVFFTLGTLWALWVVWRHRIEVLVTSNPYEGASGAVVKKVLSVVRRHVALVVESHADFEDSYFLQRRVEIPALYRWVMRRMASFALQHADALRAVSRSTQEQLVRWAPGKPVVRFPAWTDIEVFLSVKTQKGNDPRAILFVGTLSPVKGVHILLEAFARIASEFPRTELWLIGAEGDPAYVRDLRGRVRAWGLEGRVEFLGLLSQRELARRMTRALVLVLPSLSEGLGRVVFEAMAAGTPVIGSRVGGIPEMIREGETGFLVPPGDVDALTDRLRWVLSHPWETQEMERKARAFARRFFSAQAYTEHYRKLFEVAMKTREG